MLGAVLTYGTRQPELRGQELIGGIASIIAVGFVTWMVFWMRRAARTHLRRAARASSTRRSTSARCAVGLVGFLAVGREGLETALFFCATAQAAGAGTTQPLIGWVLGLAHRRRARRR